MALALLGLGTVADDGTGDTARVAGGKINAAISLLNTIAPYDGLTVANELDGTELVPVQQAGTNVQTTASLLLGLGRVNTYVGSYAGLPDPTLTPFFYAVTVDKGPVFSDGTTWQIVNIGTSQTIVPGLFTQATLPSPATYINLMAITSDIGPVFSNGVAWLQLYNLTKGTFSISVSSPIPPAQTGVAYSFTFTQTQGATPVRWSIVTKGTSSNSPAIDQNTGALTMTPTSAGTDVYLIQAVDANGAPDQVWVAITIQASLSPAGTPTFLPIAGTYTSSQSVAISTTTGSATIYYTTNGTAPTTSSAVYTGPVTVGSSQTLKAIATASGSTQSAVGSAAYVINAPTLRYKFHPGHYAVTEQVYRYSQAQTHTEIDVYAAHQNGAIGYVMGIAWYQLEVSATNLNNPASILTQYPGFASIADTFNYLQSKVPGARLGIYINANASATQVTIANIASSNYGNGFPMPKYIATCGGSLTVPNNYGSASHTTYTIPLSRGTSGFYGHGYSGYDGSAHYAELVAALWDPGINQCWINCCEALSLYSFAITSGPLSGQTLTLDNNPLIEFIAINDEYSYGMTSSQNAAGITINPPNQTSSANAPTPANYFANHKLWAQKITSFFPHTMVGLCDSFGFDASGNDTAVSMAAHINANIDGTGLSTIQGLAYSNSDTYGLDRSGGSNNTMVAGNQGFYGIANAQYNPCTLNAPTVTSLRDYMPRLDQVQPSDYQRNVGTTAYSSAAVNALFAVMQTNHATHCLWGMGDSSTFGTTAWTTYLGPAVAALAAPTATRPSNLP